MRSRRNAGDGGYTVLEATIVLPVMIVLTLLVIQYALVWHGRHVALAAAQDGLQAARAYGAPASAGQDATLEYVAQVAPRLIRRPDVQVHGTPSAVIVTLRGEVPALLSFGRFTIEERAAGPREVFVAP